MFGSDRVAALSHKAVVDDLVKDLFQKMSQGKAACQHFIVLRFQHIKG